MSQPTVAAVMLTANRPEFAARAVEAFRRQTYPNRRLIVYDTGDQWLRDSFDFQACEADFPCLAAGNTIGNLRNFAIELTEGESDIIVHWDDDDWSHPNRIAEQVALLQATGADCVGYNEMLFWRQAEAPNSPRVELHGSAWLYSNPNPRYALGTSLCYWRRVWESRPFQDINHGEDTEWLKGVRCHGVSGVQGPETYGKDFAPPRMIARIHAGNSSSAYDPIEMARHNVLPASERQWSRVPEWDKACREVMEG